MFDRFTDRNKKIMSLARQAALRLQHPYIDAEHMLLGLLEIEDGVAASVLKDLDVDRSALRADFERKQTAGPQPVTQGQLPFTPKAKRVLEESLAEASELGHNYIGSEHLLLALLRTQDTGAQEALRGAGVSIETARKAVREFLGENAENGISADDSLRSAHHRAAMAQRHAAQPPTPEQRRHLRLLLVSNSTMHGGDYLAHCSDQIREFLGAARLRVAFVPYALADHDGYERKAQQAFAALGHELRSVHRAEDPCELIANDADAVFVGGGNTFRLLETLHRTDLLRAIRRRAWAGMPYIGSSAGTNVATPSIKTTNDMPIVMPPSFDALALVPFQINPHYLDPDPDSLHMGETREERLLQFHEENDTPVLALREGCMLRVEGERMELHGTTNARLFRKGEEREEFAPPCDMSFLLETSPKR